MDHRNRDELREEGIRAYQESALALREWPPKYPNFERHIRDDGAVLYRRVDCPELEN